MLAIYLIPTMPDPRPFLCSYTVGQPYHGSILKQTLVATSTNHSEIIALYETSRESIWRRRMINHI